MKIPNQITDNERIVRSVFSPINVNKKGKLRNNVFQSPPEKDEVSVNRLNFTTPTFCKKLSQQIEQPQHKRTYFGLAVLTAKEIRETEADIVASPIKTDIIDNPFHADIKIGYIKKRGETLPTEFRLKVLEMTKKARFYLDNDLESEEWNGEELV